MLLRRLAETGATCWLLNTGWTGGAYGTGRRISIAHTRALLRAALDGTLEAADFRTEPYFGFSVPVHVPGVPDDLLAPVRLWSDADAYVAQAEKLVAAFTKNFAAFADHVSPEVRAAGPRANAAADTVANAA